MARYVVRIDLANDAFVENAGDEVARILHELAGRVEWSGLNGTTLRDVNGNTVGKAEKID